jgi:hypothetical protein
LELEAEVVDEVVQDVRVPEHHGVWKVHFPADVKSKKSFSVIFFRVARYFFYFRLFGKTRSQRGGALPPKYVTRSLLHACAALAVGTLTLKPCLAFATSDADESRGRVGWRAGETGGRGEAEDARVC